MTDPLNRTKTFTYNATGNMLTAVDAAGFTTTYANNTRGLTTSVTQPDPDGAGPLIAPVTGLAYDALGRLTTLTNPDASTQTFT
jgi:YD repeat-containing protein